MKTWHQYQHRWLVVGCTPEEKASQLVGVRSGHSSSVSVVRSSTVTRGVPELCREVVQACVSFVFVQRTQGFEVFRDRVSSFGRLFLFVGSRSLSGWCARSWI